MKRVYLVRHGEAIGNVEGIFKDPQAELTQLGYEQAANLATRCASLDFESIISSPNKRAIQTAEYIAKASGVAITTSNNFAATKFASKMVGKSKNGPEADAYMVILQEMYRRDANERYEDAENFNDLKTRFSAGFEELVAAPVDTILVVTHESILKSLLVHLLLAGEQTIEQHVSTKKHMAKLGHDSVTEFRYVEDRWQLVSWNK